MATTTVLDDAIASIVAAVKAQASTAQPNDLVYLSKAIEAIGAGSQVSFLTALAANQNDILSSTGDAKLKAVNDAGTAQLAAIAALASQDLALIASAFSQQVSTVQNLGNVSGNVVIDLSKGSTITLTPNAALTLSFSNVANTGATYWEVEIIAPQSWPVTINGVTWDNGFVPSLAGGSLTTVLTFRSRNGGAKIMAGVSFSSIA